jgi:hypothetical protein
MFKIRIIIVILIIVFGSELRATTVFITGINDLPLMSGLVLKSELPVVFDTPGGRIVEVFATGKITPASISSFYSNILPQLGWQPIAKNEFQRDKELLKIDFFDHNMGRSTVRFFVISN